VNATCRRKGLHHEDQANGLRRLARRHEGGPGAVSTQSGALRGRPYGFASRFEGQPGTNPEELIGAAHAACFTMAPAMVLGGAKLVAEQLFDGDAITAVYLRLRATVPGADAETFAVLTSKAKAICPVSKLLRADITLEAELV